MSVYITKSCKGNVKCLDFDRDIYYRVTWVYTLQRLVKVM